MPAPIRARRSRCAAALRLRWLSPGRFRSFGRAARFSELAHDVLLAAAHRDALLHPVEQHFPVRFAILHRALEAAHGGTRYQAIAVRAHESLAEFLLELGQRLL